MSPNALFLVHLPITILLPAWLTYYVGQNWVGLLRTRVLRQVAWWLVFVPLGGLSSLALLFWSEQDRVPLESILSPGFRFLGYLLTVAPLLLLLDVLRGLGAVLRRIRDARRATSLDVVTGTRQQKKESVLVKATPGLRILAGLRWCSLVAAVLLCIWGEALANSPPRVRTREIPLRRIPQAFVGYRILHLSDLHVRGKRDIRWLENVVAMANGTTPDLVAITGDVLDGPVDDPKRVLAPLSRLRAKDGVWFVLGNHEYYAGADDCVRELNRLGIHVLLDEHRIVRHHEATLVIAGVTNPQTGLHGSKLSIERGPTARLTGDPRVALHDVDHSNETLRLLLAHQPKSVHLARGLPVDLALCGHTHGGQFFPYPWLSRFVLPYVAGTYRDDDLLVHASPGLGTFGPRLRLGAPPEMTILKLAHSGYDQ
ncbi:MAG: metallophosphoesterase [Polyangiaceae bacterium]